MDLDLVWHSGEARIAFVPPVSIKDRPLHWILARSQTYYPEHILVYGSREGSLLSCRGFQRFLDRLIGSGERWRSKHHIENGSQVWGLEVQVWTGT